MDAWPSWEWRLPRPGRSFWGVWVTVFLLTACGAEELAPLEVRLLSTVGRGRGDLSFADEVFKGLNLAAVQADFYVDISEPETMLAAESQFRAWLAQGEMERRVLLITIGSDYAQFVADRGCEFNGVQVLHLDQELEDCPDLRSVSFRVFGPAFLAGVAAMQVAPRKTAAALGGMDLPTVNQFMDGFAMGVEYAGGTVLAHEYLADDFSGFSMPERAEERARELYVDADVIIPVAGGSAPGVIQAASTCDAASTCLVIGVDTDQTFLGVEVVLASVTKNLRKVTAETVLDANHGRFVGGPARLGLDTGHAGLVLNPLFSERVRQAVDGATSDALTEEERYETSH